MAQIILTPEQLRCYQDNHDGCWKGYVAVWDEMFGLWHLIPEEELESGAMWGWADRQYDS